MTAAEKAVIDAAIVYRNTHADPVNFVTRPVMAQAERELVRTVAALLQERRDAEKRRDS